MERIQEHVLGEEKLQMKDEIIVYYSPVNLRHPEANWDILNYEPEQVFNELKKQFTREERSFIGCPAVKNLLKNTFAWKNTMKSEYLVEGDKVTILSKQGISASIDHKPTLRNQTLMVLRYALSFYTSEDSLEVELTAPYFEKSPHLKYGAVVPGRFDIANWYRPINIEYNLWENEKTLILEEDETMAYLSFKTDKQVKLVRYQMTEELMKIQRVISDASIWSPKIPLMKRYERFRRSQMKQIVLKEIQKNVI